MIHPKYNELLEQQEQLLTRQNEIDPTFYNGVYDRYRYPVIIRHHVPLHWRFDLDETTNPHFMERLGINATLNPGAIYFNGKYVMVIRTEGLDRKSIFALAESDNGIDGFRFTGKPLVWEDIDADETN
ncbi:glycosidase, partial [Salmonella enterica]|nr:glycosidase [Salmonella enterica]